MAAETIGTAHQVQSTVPSSYGPQGKGAFYWPIALISHGLGSDLCQVEEHIAEARRMVHRQKVVFRPPASAHGMPLWLLESNLRQLEKHRARLRESIDRQQT